MRAWAVDEDLWVRRTAVLCQLNHSADTDADLLHDVVEANVDDRSFWLRKAIGWALREHAKTDPDWVRAEVDRLGDRLSGLSRREATRHLPRLAGWRRSMPAGPHYRERGAGQRARPRVPGRPHPGRRPERRRERYLAAGTRAHRSKRPGADLSLAARTGRRWRGLDCWRYVCSRRSSPLLRDQVATVSAGALTNCDAFESSRRRRRHDVGGPQRAVGRPPAAVAARCARPLGSEPPRRR